MRKLLFFILIAATFPVYCATSEQKQEAERYFNEYKAKRHVKEYDTARKKLEAAIALAPDEPRYLYELASYTGSVAFPFDPYVVGGRYSPKSFMALFEKFKESNKIYDKFVKKFHTYNKCLYYPSTVLEGLTNFYRNLNKPLSTEQQKQVDEEMKAYRAKVFPELQKFYWKYNPDVGINSLKEYSFGSSFLGRRCRFRFYLNYYASMPYSYEITIKFLQHGLDFFKKHPELKKKASTRFEYAFGIPMYNYPGRAAEKWKELLVKDTKLIPMAQSHPSLQIRRYGDALAIYQAFYRNKGELQLRGMIALFKKKYPDKQQMISSLAEHFKIKSPEAEKAKPKPCPAGKFRAEWLAGLNIAKQTKGINNSYLINFVATDGYKDHIYLLAVDSRQSAKIYNKPIDIALKIYDYDMKADRLEKIWELGKFKVKSQYTRNWIFHATKDYLLIGRNDQVFLVNKNGTRTYRIKDLPVGSIRDVTMYKNRIYAFLGRVNPEGTVYALETMLMSCDLNGKDRKIHLSTMRSDKQNILDKQKPFIVSTLFADPEHNRLLFVAESPVGGLWEYHPSTGKFNQLQKVGKYDCVRSWGRKAGDKLYYCFDAARRKYYVYDLNTNKLAYLFFDEKDKYVKRGKQKPEYQKFLNVGSWFFPTQTDIWFAQHWGRIQCISRDKSMNLSSILLRNIKNYEILIPSINSNMHQYPLVDERCIPFPLYQHPDGKTMIVVTNHHILALKRECEK